MSTSAKYAGVKYHQHPAIGRLVALTSKDLVALMIASEHKVELAERVPMAADRKRAHHDEYKVEEHVIVRMPTGARPRPEQLENAHPHLDPIRLQYLKELVAAMAANHRDENRQSAYGNGDTPAGYFLALEIDADSLRHAKEESHNYVEDMLADRPGESAAMRLT